MHAVQEGFLDVVELLLSHKADPNIRDNNRETALIWAAKSAKMNDDSFPSVVDPLIARGADVNAKNSDGQTALMIAARDGQLEFVRRLLQSSANLKEKDAMGANWTALDYAESFGHPEIVELLKKGK